MSADELHLDRARAESFGSVATDYDRYRPSYLDALYDDLLAARPQRVLDVGCGTGKFAVGLVERGVALLGVELDPRMAEIARGHDIPVEVSAFETWDVADRQFDLITCAQAWHWIDPERGVAKAAEALRPGGTIARFWNHNEVDEPLTSALEAVYSEHAPDAGPHLRAPGEDTDYVDPFDTSDAFTGLETRIYRVDRLLSADEWVGMAATFSDHQRLAPERLAELSRAVRATIDAHGGTVRAQCRTLAVLARRA